jgi:hypothetical protein
MGIVRPLPQISPKIQLGRCSLKPPLRTKSVGTKVSEAEFALLEERARGAGLRLAEWVREALLSAPVELGPDSGEVALAELLLEGLGMYSSGGETQAGGPGLGMLIGPRHGCPRSRF